MKEKFVLEIQLVSGILDQTKANLGLSTVQKKLNYLSQKILLQ